MVSRSSASSTKTARSQWQLAHSASSVDIRNAFLQECTGVVSLLLSYLFRIHSDRLNVVRSSTSDADTELGLQTPCNGRRCATTDDQCQHLSSSIHRSMK
jgi:hypothetical protein